MNIKVLIEKREALKVELNKQMQDVQAEFRAFTDAESKKFDDTTEEIRKLDETIEKIKNYQNENFLEEVDGKVVDTRSKQDDVIEEIRSGKIKDGITLSTDFEKEEFEKFNEELRNLENFLKGKKTDETRVLDSTTASALTPTFLYKDIIKQFVEVAPLFSMITKLTPVSGKLDILREDTLGSATFVAENADLALTDVTFQKATLEQRRCGAVIQITQHLINDSGIDVVAYAKDLLYRMLGQTLDRTIVTGTVANNQFEGLGACDNFITENAINLDALLKAYLFLNRNFHEGAVWIMNRAIFNEIVIQKDALNHFFFIQEVVNGTVKYKILGHDVHIVDTCPDKRIYFTNLNATFGAMIKKNPTLKVIDKDTTNALRGTTTLVLDIYADVKIKNKHATVELRER